MREVNIKRSFLLNSDNNLEIKRATYKQTILLTDEQDRQRATRGTNEIIVIPLTKNSEYSYIDADLGSVNPKKYISSAPTDAVELVLFYKSWWIVRREFRREIEYYKTSKILDKGLNYTAKVDFNDDYTDDNAQNTKGYDNSYIELENGLRFYVSHIDIERINDHKNGILVNGNEGSDGSENNSDDSENNSDDDSDISSENENGLVGSSFVEIYDVSYSYNSSVNLKICGDFWWLIEYKKEEKIREFNVSEILCQGSHFEEDVIIITAESIEEIIPKEKLELENLFSDSAKSLAEFRLANSDYLEFTFIKVAIAQKTAELRVMLKAIQEIEEIGKTYEANKEKRKLDAKLNAKNKSKDKNPEQIDIDVKIALELENAEQKLRDATEKREIEQRIIAIKLRIDSVIQDYEVHSRNDVYKTQIFAERGDVRDGDYDLTHCGVTYHGKLYEGEVKNYRYAKYSHPYMIMHLPQTIAEITDSVGKLLEENTILQKSKSEIESELDKLKQQEKSLIDEKVELESKLSMLENEEEKYRDTMPEKVKNMVDVSYLYNKISHEQLEQLIKFDNDILSCKKEIEKCHSLIKLNEIEQAKLQDAINIADTVATQNKIKQNQQQITELEKQIDNEIERIFNKY